MSIIRNGNVALSNSRKPHVALSNLRKPNVAMSILRKCHVACRQGLVRAPRLPIAFYYKKCLSYCVDFRIRESGSWYDIHRFTIPILTFVFNHLFFIAILY